MGSEWILGDWLGVWSRWKDGIRMDFRRLAGRVEWNQLAQDRDRWRAPMNTVMNLRVWRHGVSYVITTPGSFKSLRQQRETLSPLLLDIMAGLIEGMRF
jgi:hypothetical protein